MAKNFMQAVKTTLDDEYNYSVTENGALGYRTTGHELLDLNFQVSSLRHVSADEIVNRFKRAFFEDKILAMKWLFFARDVRGGMGERRLFRAVITDFANSNPEYITPLLFLIPEYGRYDDLWCLLDTRLSKRVISLVADQLNDDIRNEREGKSISLLAKWLPSVNASARKTRDYARKLYRGLNMTERQYRKTVSSLRKKLDVVERKMSAKQWGDIVYEAVPSRANLVYNDAFLRNDESRRREFLEGLKKGEGKINSSVLFPHEIVSRYRSKNYDEALEQLWKALPDTVHGCGNTIVVQDDSASMTWVTLPNSTARPLEVANALAIYFAERSSGQFKDKFLTFSNDPDLIDLGRAKNLKEKLRIVNTCSVGGSTNVEAVFDLILKTAIGSHMDQSEMPQNVLVISDMEFNDCANAGRSDRGRWGYEKLSTRLFDEISRRYKSAGYKLPRLIFWNVASRTGTIPVKENEMGVALVSGFSVNVVRMVMSGKLDPYEALLETINAERYEPIAEALSGV